MCYMQWVSDPFIVRDIVEFEEWLNYWPDVDYVRMGLNDAVQLFGRDEYGEGCGLPLMRFDPDVDDYVDTEDETVFLEELSYRISPDDCCVIKEAHTCWTDMHVGVVVINGGGQDFEDRHLIFSLDEVAYSRATDLAGGMLLLAAE